MCVPIAIATGGVLGGCFAPGTDHGLSVAALAPVYGIVVWNFRSSIPHRIRQLRQKLGIHRPDDHEHEHDHCC